MKYLFVHQNFPGQYLHVVRHLAQDPQNEIVFITQRKDAQMAGVRCVIYSPKRKTTKGIHHYLADTEAGILNAQSVAEVGFRLKSEGFEPDIMLGHNGWGEIWYLKDVWPSTPLVGYFEFFYQAQGADVGFDPLEQTTADTGPRIRSKNIGNILGLQAADFGQTPTQWQRSLYPEKSTTPIHVIHEGVNTDQVKPDPEAWLRFEKAGVTLTANDEVITYVARNLEPYRGFDQFMRSLPAIQKARPNAHVVIIGGDSVSYGRPLAGGTTYRQRMLEELSGQLDMSRIHFAGKVPYSTFLKVLQVSTVHVYLTFPFVLSWSMLEAMSAGCLIVGSRTAPVEEVVQHEVNGLLVDFFSPDQLAIQVVGILSKGKQAYQAIRRRARETIVEGYDLNRVCLPAHLQMIETAIASGKESLAGRLGNFA